MISMRHNVSYETFNTFHHVNLADDMIIPRTPPPIQTLTTFAPFLTELTPLLTHRVTTPTAPPTLPLTTRAYLTSLSDETLSQIDTQGAITYFSTTETPIPTYLRQLAFHASKISTTFPYLPIPIPTPKSTSRRRTSSRPHSAKRSQIALITNLVNHILSSIQHPNPRILDIGAGHAHLAAHLANNLNCSITAVDTNQTFIRTANKLYNHHSNLTIHQHHLTTQTPLSSDFLLGLHSCGALGDALISLATTHQPAAALLISCCLQKTSHTYRTPLSNFVNSNPSLSSFFTLPRHNLGVTNRPRASPSPQNLYARITRHALRSLLLEHIPNLPFGNEVTNLSRHSLKQGLFHVAPKALAIHGLPITISSEEAHHRMDIAEREYRLMRALSIPRILAGEVLEMAVVLDRAAALQEAGYRTILTCRVWPDHISPRNLCCAAW